MADSIGAKIGLEGEAQFKSALYDITQSFKVLGSEMKLATSEFDKNEVGVESLTAKNNILEKQVDAQKEKILLLKQALDNASNSFGEGDKRTQKWAIELNNAQATLNDMEHELQSNTTAIDKMGSEMVDTSTATDKLKKSISDQENELSKLKGEYSDIVLTQGKSSESAQELEKRLLQLNDGIAENKSKLEGAENAADRYVESQNDTSTATDKLKKSISDQESELNKLKSRYSDVVLTQGKGSSAAKETV